MRPKRLLPLLSHKVTLLLAGFALLSLLWRHTNKRFTGRREFVPEWRVMPAGSVLRAEETVLCRRLGSCVKLKARPALFLRNETCVDIISTVSGKACRLGWQSCVVPDRIREASSVNRVSVFVGFMSSVFRCQGVSAGDWLTLIVKMATLSA
jgi:hypothetical protein